MSSRSLPLMIRAMSSRSSTSRSCDARVALDDLEARASRRLEPPAACSRICVQPSTALSGVRISWDSVARNSSFSRDASSATSRAPVRAAIWLRSSRSLTTRSVTSSMTVIVPTIGAVDGSAARCARSAPCRLRRSPSRAGHGIRNLWKRLREHAHLACERVAVVARRGPRSRASGTARTAAGRWRPPAGYRSALRASGSRRGRRARRRS